MESYRKIYPLEFHRQFLLHGVRPDGRKLSTSRKTKLNVGLIETADGSAFVKLGHTSVIAGVVGEIGPPPPNDLSFSQKNPQISNYL